MSEILFKAGGALTANLPVYIVREADEKAAANLRRMECISLIEPREHGKTSLINRLISKFKDYGYSFVFRDLMPAKASATSSAVWYASLGKWVLRSLYFIPRDQRPELPTDSASWEEFLIEIAEKAESMGQRVVIVLDEIGAIPPDWATDFFSIIRSVYNSRESFPCLQHITFVIAGAYNPKELIRDENVSTFNMDQRILIHDFNFSQVKQLVSYLDLPADVTEVMTGRVYYWTDGQPYLCQRLCYYLEEQNGLGLASIKDVDTLVDNVVERFFKEDTHHLSWLKILDTEPELLTYTLRITSEPRTRFNAAVNDKHFRLAHIIGVIKTDSDGLCRIRNRIYEKALAEFEALVSPKPIDAALLRNTQVTMSVAEMQPEDIEELRRIIGSLSQITDEAGRGRRVLLEEAGLGRLVGDIDLTGTAREFGGRLINQLKYHRPLQVKPDHEVLGVLLFHIMTLQEIPLTDRALIKSILRRYGLVPLFR